MKFSILFTIIIGIKVHLVYSNAQSAEGCFLPDIEDCVKQFQGQQCTQNQVAFRDRCYQCSCGPLKTFVCWNFCKGEKPEVPTALAMDLCKPGELFYKNPRNKCKQCVCGYDGRKSLSNCKNKPLCWHLD